jgi:DNA-binding FadR family transcriptional regulator
MRWFCPDTKETAIMPSGQGRADFGQLYADVFEHLASGIYRPGDRIELKALSSHLGVSVTPLREIFSRFVGRDMVTERRGEGYYLVRLDARDLADLYNLHHVCIELAIARPLTLPSNGNALPEDIWALFDAVVKASGDRILAGVRRYLDDQLMLVRRCERMLLDDETQALQTMRAAILQHDIDAVRAEAAAFHVARSAVARSIAEIVNRNRPV